MAFFVMGNKAFPLDLGLQGATHAVRTRGHCRVGHVCWVFQQCGLAAVDKARTRASDIATGFACLASGVAFSVRITGDNYPALPTKSRRLSSGCPQATPYLACPLCILSYSSKTRLPHQCSNPVKLMPRNSCASAGWRTCLPL